MQAHAAVMNYGKGWWPEHVWDCERGHATSLSSLRLNLIFRDRATAGGGMWTLLLCCGYELWEGGLGTFVTGGWHKSRAWTHTQIHIATQPFDMQTICKICNHAISIFISQSALRCSIDLACVLGMCGGVHHVYAWVQYYTNMNLLGSSY